MVCLGFTKMSSKAMSVREKFSIEFVSGYSVCSKTPSSAQSELPAMLLFDAEDVYTPSFPEPEKSMENPGMDAVSELRALFGRVDN